MSLCLNCAISWFTVDLQTQAPGADCLQKSEVEFIGNAPFLFMSANIFSAPSNMRLCLAGKNGWMKLSDFVFVFFK